MPVSKQSFTVEMPQSSLSSSSKTASQNPERVDPYTTLPQPSSSYIRLRFQLCGFQDVYRIVKVPLSYTFANFHTLVLFLFGWNGSHLHQSHVYSDVKMDEDDDKPGHMAEYGIVPPLPEWIEPDDETEIYFWEVQHHDCALYKVAPGKRQPPSGGCMNYSYLARVNDQDLTLGQVWCVGGRYNASQGECDNKEIGIKYEYDLGAGWSVDITCPSGDPFYHVDPPSNMPIIMDAKGAPPIEDIDEDEVFGEDDPEDKTIMPLLFDQSSFGLYCQGVLDTKKCLAVFNALEGFHEAEDSDEDDDMDEEDDDINME